MSEIELKARIISILSGHTREMEGYSYFSSNPGIPEDEYEEIADEVIAALAPQWQPIEFNEDGEPTNVPADTPILVPPTKRLGMTVAKWNPLDGWETETTSEWVGMYRPAHFQPLPAPPEVEG